MVKLITGGRRAWVDDWYRESSRALLDKIICGDDGNGRHDPAVTDQSSTYLFSATAK